MSKSSVSTQCKECGKQYKINLKGVSTQYVKFTCQECQAINVVENPNHDTAPSYDLDTPEPAGDETRAKFAGSLFSSIRTKITLVLVLLVLVSLTTVGWFASSESKDALISQAESFLALNTKQKSSEYALSFKRIQHEVETIARFTKILYERPLDSTDLHVREHILMPWSGKGYGSPELNRKLQDEILTIQHLVPYLKSIVKNHPLAQAGYIGTDTRIMLMDNPAAIKSIGQLKGYENTKRPWYLKAVKEKRTIWSEPYIDADTKDIIMTCATPVILSNGRLAAVAAYDVKLSTIQQDILTLDIGYNGYAMLVDSSGKTLVRPGMQKGDLRWDSTYNTDDLLRTSNTAFNKVVTQMIAGRSGVETFGTAEGEKMIAFAPLPEIGASLAIVVNKGEVVEPATRIRNIILAIWAVVMVLAIVAGFLIGNGITKPINELTVAADRISQGEMDLEILTEDRKDEIGRLTQAFNRLVTSLKIAMSVR